MQECDRTTAKSISSSRHSVLLITRNHYPVCPIEKSSIAPAPLPRASSQAASGRNVPHKLTNQLQAPQLQAAGRKSTETPSSQSRALSLQAAGRNILNTPSSQLQELRAALEPQTLGRIIPKTPASSNRATVTGARSKTIFERRTGPSPNLSQVAPGSNMPDKSTGESRVASWQAAGRIIPQTPSRQPQAAPIRQVLGRAIDASLGS
jgi:hypothetical protein